MDNRFFEQPILNSPYKYPARHWELDDQGQPTQRIIESRRRAEFITPIPKPRKHKGSAGQLGLIFDEGKKGLSTQDQQYNLTAIINEIRRHVDTWRSLPNPSDWQVTPETARLLQHWRHHKFSNIRPFFCQIEAVETAIWLTEAAPKAGKADKKFLEHLANANNDANPDLMRLALKLATGAGKTTVMAMLIAWQTINAVRRPTSKKFTRGFLVVTPGLTIRDRLRVLLPNDPDSYYGSRELAPTDMLADLERAKIIITNSLVGERPIKAVLDPYNPTGSTIHVNFNTSKTLRWETDSRRCHINWVILDSDWEAEFCRVAEAHPRVKAYVKNHNLGLEVPYRYGSEMRMYRPDFIVLVDDGRDDPLHLIVEIKGYRREDAKEKKSTMENYWAPGVNNLHQYGRWAFAEFTEVYQIESDFEAKVEAEFSRMIQRIVKSEG